MVTCYNPYKKCKWCTSEYKPMSEDELENMKRYMKYKRHIYI